MRILFLIRDLEPGGAERQLVTLANAMAHAGHVAVTVGVFCSGGKFEGALDRSAVELVDLRKGGSWPSLSFLQRLRTLVRELRPDVVHSYARSANTWAALAMLGLPGVLVWGVRNAVSHARELDSELADIAARVLRRRVGLVIANSSGAAAALVERGYPRCKYAPSPMASTLSGFAGPLKRAIGCGAAGAFAKTSQWLVSWARRARRRTRRTFSTPPRLPWSSSLACGWP
ncbi:MAG: glycosyltransferase [Bryobacterales bacterium]